MKLTIGDARQLIEQAMTAFGYTKAEADIIADHLMDCELRGLSYGGLARAVSIIDRLKSTSDDTRPITVTQESPISAAIDGGDQVGYLVARRAVELALEKAEVSGIAVVGAKETWYTGMFSYYLEMITKAGFAGMIAGSGGNIVAPEGGAQARFATNPIAFGFPTKDIPVIWDIGTSNITLAEVLLHWRTGELLPKGLAFDKNCKPTRDPLEALDGGALTAWGGHRGSGLAMMIQLLGMMCGAAASPDGLRDCGFFLLVVNPALLTDVDDYKQRVSDYAQHMRETIPINNDQPVRVPFERSYAHRKVTLANNHIDVVDEVYENLRLMAEQVAAD